ncbi:MAG: dUTP diphosphatase [Actinobacteria bacterium]|nr:dUTP diphosphatase [Actinomycetota bacterium]
MTSASPERVRVGLRRLDPEMPVPGYAHAGDAGADLAIAEDCDLAPGERKLVGTGLAIALPECWAAFVHPRSGLAARSGLTIVNAPGTVDAGYRGEIRISLLNTDSSRAISLRRGDLIAQLVVQRVAEAEFELLDQLPESHRGERGHGSTGGVAEWAATEAANTTTEVKK